MRHRMGIVGLVLLFAACAQDHQAAREQLNELPPSLEEARGAAYYGLAVVDGAPVTLADGLWQREPSAPDSSARPSVNLVRNFTAAGEIDSGGVDEIAVLLAERSGGTGERIYIALIDKAGDAITNTATLLLGDRVQVRSVSVEPGSITAEVVQAATADPMCCPGDIVRRSWTLEEGKFTESSAPEVLGRLSPETVGETEWALRWWDWEERAGDEPLITLTYSDGRFAGHSGCNSYTGAVAAGDQPGDIVLSPIVSTRMAFPDLKIQAESRYLKNLQAATKFGFMAGDLMITYQDETGAVGAMLFAPHAGLQA